MFARGRRSFCRVLGEHVDNSVAYRKAPIAIKGGNVGVGKDIREHIISPRRLGAGNAEDVRPAVGFPRRKSADRHRSAHSFGLSSLRYLIACSEYRHTARIPIRYQ